MYLKVLLCFFSFCNYPDRCLAATHIHLSDIYFFTMPTNLVLTFSTNNNKKKRDEKRWKSVRVCFPCDDSKMRILTPREKEESVALNLRFFPFHLYLFLCFVTFFFRFLDVIVLFSRHRRFFRCCYSRSAFVSTTQRTTITHVIFIYIKHQKFANIWERLWLCGH